MMKIEQNPARKRITCIQLKGAFPDFCEQVVMPDYGMPLIGTILSGAGYDVIVYMEHIQPPEWDCIARSHLVCMSTLSAAADKTYNLAKKIRSELNIPVIMGGTHATYFPESCLEYCDYVVLNEGDETILELCDTLLQCGDVSAVPGIVYKKNGQVVQTRQRAAPENFPTIPDFSLIKGYKKFSILDIILTRRFPLLTVQSSRGCPFTCKYCIVDKMFSGSYRMRDIESVIKDLKNKKKYSRKMMFVDNNFAGNKAYTKKLLQRMIEENLGLDILVLTRVDIARDDELLLLMRQAGITRHYQGYESIQPETLTHYNKGQKVEEIIRAINKLHDYGFRLSGSFIFGADTDTLATLSATVQFALDQNLAIAYFFPLWGHYNEKKNNNSSLVPRHRSIFKGWAYCDGNFVTHFPLQMRPSDLQKALINAHRTFFSLDSVVRALKQRHYKYAWDKAGHRWMWSRIEKSLLHYITWLQKHEHGLYDKNNKLCEDRLIEGIRRGSWPVFPGYLDNGTIDPFSLITTHCPDDDLAVCTHTVRDREQRSK